jgi:hypothetical protein
VWLDPLRVALDEASGPVDFFVRDDDAGWDDERLFAMLAVERDGRKCEHKLDGDAG